MTASRKDFEAGVGGMKGSMFWHDGQGGREGEEGGGGRVVGGL